MELISGGTENIHDELLIVYTTISYTTGIEKINK